MEEAGILENSVLLNPLLPDFEPGPKVKREMDIKSDFIMPCAENQAQQSSVGNVLIDQELRQMFLLASA